jgi:hypothetical protein
VKQETERIESTFLEPACGNGNFLTEVLRRKLRVIKRRDGKSPLEYERYTVLAVGSIYGIDILEDNVLQCRQRLFEIVERHIASLFPRDEFLRTIRFVLQRNVIWGDALTHKTVGDDPKPIVFSHWSVVNGSMVKRFDYTFHELLSHAHTRQAPLFSDLGEEVFLPEPVKEYPLSHYLELADAEGK